MRSPCGQAYPLSHSVHRHLLIEIRAYDEMIRRLIPGYDEMVRIAAREVTRRCPRLVLDLGAGTGALSEAILRASGDTTVESIDVDREMLSQAAARLGQFGSRVRLTERSFLEPLQPCAAVAASISLHHVRSMNTKRALYRGIHAALVPDGTFVNADSALANSPAATEAIWRDWIDHMGIHGIDEDQAREHFAQWSQEGTYFTIEEELAAVRSAEFDAECVWRHGPMAVLVGRKAL